MPAVRFDDRLETIAQIDPTLPSGRVAIWHQLLDLLAQTGAQLDEQRAARTLAALASVRPHVPVAMRAQSVRAVANRCTFAPLIAFLANDSPTVAVAAVDAAGLDDAGWQLVVPQLGPVGRSRLRQRSNNSAALRWALHHYDAADFALSDMRTESAQVAPESVAVNDEDRTTGTAGIDDPADATSVRTHNIAELVQRIDRFRAQRGQGGQGGDDIRALRFDAEGVLRAVAGLNRAQFVGLSLRHPAPPTEAGCDAGVARAFAKRAPIRDGRLALPGGSGAMDFWLFDADPEFDRASGRFIGYSGSLRQPAKAGDPAWSASAQNDVDNRADGMRQLVHELRSPLNAISGFSQLIHGQFFGPVSEPYRAVAAGILDDARHLTLALEDIELAAKLDAGRLEVTGGSCDLAERAKEVCRQLGCAEPTIETANPAQAAQPPFLVTMSGTEADVMISRVLRCAEYLTDSASALEVRLRRTARGDAVEFVVGQAATSTVGGAVQPTPQGKQSATASADANLFDRQFRTRLCAQLAELHGGELRTTANSLTLRLPLISLEILAG